jgi:hypothetical protein
MENPFPGMNPYLEQSWRDVHHRLITYAGDQIAPRLPRDLRARIDERVFVASEDELERGIYPDIRVVERPAMKSSPSSGASNLALAEPIVVRVDSEPMREAYIKIVEAGSGDRVVTVIEFLSLSNKVSGDGRDQYLQKQKECLGGRVSLVEIDLLRSGKRAMAIPESRVPRRCRTPYRICVKRGWVRSAFELYPVPIQFPLPAIRIPLRKSDTDIALELQPLIDSCYRNGVYDDINYQRPPNPPLDAEDEAWADELLKGRSLRK